MEIDNELLDWAHQNEVCVRWMTDFRHERILGVYCAYSDRGPVLYDPKNWADGATIADAIRALREKIGGVK